MVEPGWWRAADFGTAVRRPDGWYASRGSYPDKFFEPIVGPFKARKQACAAYEAAMRERSEQMAKKGKQKPPCGAKTGTTGFVPCDLPRGHLGFKHDVRDKGMAAKVEAETDKIMDMALTALECERCKKVYGYVEGEAPAGYCSRDCVREVAKENVQMEQEAKGRPVP